MKSNFELFVEEIGKVYGTTVYGCENNLTNYDCLPYIEIRVDTNLNVKKVKDIVAKYGYKVANEDDVEGSDYPAYYIWFANSTKK